MHCKTPSETSFLHLPAPRKAAPANLSCAPPNCPQLPQLSLLGAPPQTFIGSSLPRPAKPLELPSTLVRELKESQKLIQGAKPPRSQRVWGGGSGGRLKTSPPHILYSASVANSLRSQRTEAPGIPESYPSPARRLGHTHGSCTEPGCALLGTHLQAHRLADVSSFSKHPERKIFSDPGCAALIFPE